MNRQCITVTIIKIESISITAKVLSGPFVPFVPSPPHMEGTPLISIVSVSFTRIPYKWKYAECSVLNQAFFTQSSAFKIHSFFACIRT